MSYGKTESAALFFIAIAPVHPILSVGVIDVVVFAREKDTGNPFVSDGIGVGGVTTMAFCVPVSTQNTYHDDEAVLPLSTHVFVSESQIHTVSVS